MSRGVFITLVLHALVAAAVIGLTARTVAPRVPPERTSGKVERLLDGVLEKHRVEMSKRRGCLYGRNENVWNLFLKARLVTLAVPNVTEGLLLDRALDPTRPLPTRAFSVTLLGELCRTGRTNLETTLQFFAMGPEPTLAETALRALSAADTAGRFLDLYRSKCHAESWAAFDAVSYWHDPITVQQMERIADSPGNQWPESSLRLSAQNVLARLRILASPDCDATLTRILDGSRDSHEFEWALTVARIKQMTGLTTALRRRLDRAQGTISPDASEAEKYDYDRMVWEEGDPFAQVAAGRYLDEHFDDALIAYAELGGSLNVAEWRRLTLFGYLGDSVTRVNDMLEGKD